LALQKVPVVVGATSGDGSVKTHISIDARPTNSPAEVYVVLAMDRVSTAVSAGENSGRKLEHTAVAYSLEKVGTLDDRKFDRDINVALSRKMKSSALRIIVFVQDKKTGHIVGAAQAKV